MFGKRLRRRLFHGFTEQGRCEIQETIWWIEGKWNEEQKDERIWRFGEGEIYRYFSVK